MKILFIYPNSGSQIGFNYGVAHLSALLKEAGHQVSLWQICEAIAPLPDQGEFRKRLQEAGPDLIGFSVVTNQWPLAKKLAQWARGASSVPIVCGGIHTMAAGREILESGFFDYIMRGEAEEALLEFVEKFAKGEDLTEIRNLGFIQDGQIRINPLRPLPDLKKLPMKDYGLFDFQKIIDAKNGWVGLMASRGCPFACTYCFNHQVVAQYQEDLGCGFKDLNYIRHFDIALMMREIRYLLTTYERIKMFILDDDLFTFYRKYVTEFCREYKKISSIPFVVNAHVEVFDEERAKSLAEANCRIVKFGVESGSERIRRQILQRRMSNEHIEKAISIAHHHQLHTSVFLMIGLPDETEEDLLATIRLMAKTKPGRYRWSFFFPFPGTKAQEIAEEKNAIDHDKMKRLENFTGESCLDFGAKQNLLLKKVGRLMPWFVNAYADLDVSEYYRGRIEQILAMDEETWATKADALFQEDQLLSREFVSKGLTHYAIKYNPFMGVISDYFVRHE